MLRNARLNSRKKTQGAVLGGEESTEYKTTFDNAYIFFNQNKIGSNMKKLKTGPSRNTQSIYVNMYLVQLQLLHFFVCMGLIEFQIP